MALLTIKCCTADLHSCLFRLSKLRPYCGLSLACILSQTVTDPAYLVLVSDRVSEVPPERVW